MSNAISHRAMDRAFHALVTSCEAAVTAAVAATEERFEPPAPLPPACDPLHAIRRVVRLACQLEDALFEYCVATQLHDLDPDHDDDHEDSLDDQNPPF